MSMLITERAVITPQKTARVRPVPVVAPVARRVEVVAPTVAKPVVQANPLKRQNLLLLTLLMIPLIGGVYNILTYGLVR